MITQKDLEGINTYGFDYTIDSWGCMTINLPHATILVQARPKFCDRGRYSFIADVREGHYDKLNIDCADAFPRYFFKLQRALDECKDWVDFNQEKLGLTKKEEQEL